MHLASRCLAHGSTNSFISPHAHLDEMVVKPVLTDATHAFWFISRIASEYYRLAVSVFSSSLYALHSSSACPTAKHLFQAVLAVLVGFLKVVLLLLQVGHVGFELIALRREPLLHVWNWCADKPAAKS